MILFAYSAIANLRIWLIPSPQIADVQRSWDNMRAGRNAMVSSLFIKLFKEIPRVQQYFDKFAAVPVDAFPVILNSTNRSLW